MTQGLVLFLLALSLQLVDSVRYWKLEDVEEEEPERRVSPRTKDVDWLECDVCEAAARFAYR